MKASKPVQLKPNQQRINKVPILRNHPAQPHTRNKQLATEKAHQDNTAKPSDVIDNEEEDEADHDDEEGEEDEDDGKEDDDESVKVQAALANAAAAKKQKEESSEGG